MNKTVIKNFAIWARNKLIADITYKAGLIGVSEKGIAKPLPQSTKDLQFFDIGTKDYVQVAGADIEQRNALVRAIQEKERTSDYKTAFKAVIEEVAYTWFNRLIAIRFLEVNEYLPSRIRVLSSENPAKNEPDFVTVPFDTDMEFTMAEQDRIMQLKDENKLDELFRMLFIKQCNKLHEILPELFEETNNYTELLLSISFTDSDGVVYHLVHDIPEDDFNVEKEGQVEIIGWLYQYYNIEPKAKVFAKKSKISKEEIPAATQLFTPDWIVRYMVENSLGRLWVEGHPNDSLKESWKYYLEESEQEASVEVQLEQIRAEYRDLKLEDIKVIDPCMGSGHILVYCFDVLMQIYESQGYTQRDAAQSILENNLFGLDIDKRAAQLAYFAVMMKARQYDRRIFSRGVHTNVYAFVESQEINSNHVKLFGALLNDEQQKQAKNDITYLLDKMQNSKEFGSLLEIRNCDWHNLSCWIEDLDVSGQMTLDAIGSDLTQIQLKKIIKLCEVMAKKYHVVCTNPPYMGNASAKLATYLHDNYPDEKYDTYAAFIEKSNMFVKNGCFTAMVTGESWMFLPSFINMRGKLIRSSDTVSMAHFGFGAFDGGFGTTAFVFRKGFHARYKSTFIRLVDERLDSDKEKLLCGAKENNANTYICSQNDFNMVEGSPYVYWMNRSVLESFNKSNLGDHAITKAGIVTGNNDFFMKFWHEISYEDISFGTKTGTTDLPKYVPAHKGGGNRRYYGNLDYVMRLNDLWKPSLAKSNMRRGDQDFYFLEGLTWSTLSNQLAFRYSPTGFVYETKGSMCFVNHGENVYYVLGLLNSSLCDYIMNILSPTLDFNRSSLLKMPFIRSEAYEKEVIELTQRCVKLAKDDWDADETSWDFKKHPLV